MSEEWFPWYPALYSADTLHLTAAQDGIYRRLIDWYMEKRRPLPSNPQALAAIARIGIDDWKANEEIILAFFRESPSGLQHKRCNAILDDQDTRSTKRSEIAKMGAAARWRALPDAPRTAPEANNDASSMPEACSEHDGSMLGQNATGQDRTGQITSSLRSDVTRERDETNRDFSETFWPRYPHKVGKPKALKAFSAARRKASLATIMAGLERYIAGKPPDREWLNPATFLNQERWADTPAAKTVGPDPPTSWTERAEWYRKLGRWPAYWGPRDSVPKESRHLFPGVFEKLQVVSG